MFVKRFKKKCGVRGCKNISDVFILSKRREMGNTIAMCRECMVDALKSTENYTEEVKAKAEPKPLFPHPELNVTLSSVADTKEPEPNEAIEGVTEETPVSVAEDTVTIDNKTSAKASTNSKKTNKKK